MTFGLKLRGFGVSAFLYTAISLVFMVGQSQMPEVCGLSQNPNKPRNQTPEPNYAPSTWTLNPKPLNPKPYKDRDEAQPTPKDSLHLAQGPKPSAPKAPEPGLWSTIL